MTRVLRRLGVFALAAGLSAVPAPPAADACAPAPPRNVVVEVASESAVVAWDPATRTQHFVRRAAFNATAGEGAQVRDFGFLVPTPTRPELAEADDRAFEELAKVTAPKTEKRPRPSGGCGFGCGSASKSDGSSVEVLEEKRVGGYDAKVLKATDAEALAAWLREHEYESRPALTAWLKPYVEKGWIVTAFKIARAPDSPAGRVVGTSAVRMSFKADAPFFPYSEPEDARSAKTRRLLRVFVLSDTKVDGRKEGKGDWGGKVVWAGKLTTEQAQELAPLLKIPGYKVDASTWVTEFEDPSSPRPGDADVTFAPHPNQDPVERPTRIVYALRSDATGKAGFAVLAAGVAGFYLLLRLRFAPKRRGG